MDVLLSTAQWVVGKALAPVVDGVLGHWDASKNLGLNVDALSTELLLVKATLEAASRKQIGGQAMEELLCKLRDSARCAEDLLDELDYFRIHDELHGTYDAAHQHAKGGVHDLALNARHTAKAVGKQLLGLSSAANPVQPRKAVEDARQHVGCCAWPRRSHHTSSSTPNAKQSGDNKVTGCMPMLGKLLPCSSSPNVHDDNSGSHSTLFGVPRREHAEETTMLGFNRVDFSQRMMNIVEQLQPVRREFSTILQSFDPIIVRDIAQSRPITTGQSIEPILYGRDRIVNSIIHDITNGKYRNKDLTVLPIVGPGGIGKTTLIQHIYKNQEVQNQFHVIIWVCVSLNFNLNKILEDMRKDIPPVEVEKGDRTEELVEQRLKSKRFLLVLDDIWECSNEDDWKRLLLLLKTSQEKGSMILVTTRFPAIATMVKTSDYVELEGLESEEFKKLFLAFVFGNEPFRADLLETGDKIMEKLKGSPLAAKTVGTLLRKDLNLRHWKRVLESKEWERQSGANDIMPALKLSYDYLPFHQKQCFSYSALFPEDHKYTSTELINLWIGLDILQPGAGNQTMEDIGLRILNDLVTHGFFREEETNGSMHYVMHDLLHDLALKVASHECHSVCHSNVKSVEIYPSICHLSIIIDNKDTVFTSLLSKLKTRLKFKQLHTLMIFGEMDESFAKILGDLFREANSLRVLRLVNMPCSVESMFHNFSALVHLRYLCLGTEYGRKMHLPLAISRFYHLRILDLGSWYDCRDLPKDMSNLTKLRHFYTPSDELHSNILNVGNLILLEELKVFRVNKESEGFEPKQLGNLTELRELGIYNLENIHTREEAAQVKLIEKDRLERLTLVWDSEKSKTEPGVEEAVLDSLKPHAFLEYLCIRGHKGSSCPRWLGDKQVVEALQSLHVDGVSWQCLPSLGKMHGLGKIILENIPTIKEFVIEQSFCRLIRLEVIGLESFEKWEPSHDAYMFPLLQVLIIRNCPKLSGLPLSDHIVCPKPDQDKNIGCFPKLQELKICDCEELLVVVRIPWTETLCTVHITNVKLLNFFWYHKKSSLLCITGKDDLQSLAQVLEFHNLKDLEELTLFKCPPLESKHLLMLTSLKIFDVDNIDGLVRPTGGEWQHPIENLVVYELCGASGKEMTELLTHLPRLSKLAFHMCENITKISVTTASEVEKEEDGLLLIPTHLSDSLRYFSIRGCPELVLVDPSAARGDGFQALRSLETLVIWGRAKFRSFSCCLFPPSLQKLHLERVEGMGTLEPLSNLTSLTELKLYNCGEDLRCKGLGSLLTARAQLRVLVASGSPKFFAGWDLNPRWVQDYKGGEEQELDCPPKLEHIWTDDVMGLLVAPICSFLSSSLTHLILGGKNYEMERFSKDKEDALLLLASLRQLEFYRFSKLQHLPAGLHKLTNLKRLVVELCPAVWSLPKDGLPKSLEVLSVSSCGNEELKLQCRGLLGTIPRTEL